MNKYEKYEELIRQKFAEKEFIFNEENWEKAEKMIDSDKKSKTILWWSCIFLIGVITGSCIVFCLTKTDHPKPEAYPIHKHSIHHKRQLQDESIENNSGNEHHSSAANSSVVQISQPLPGTGITSDATHSVALDNEQKINNGDLPDESMRPYLASNPTKKKQVAAHGSFADKNQVSASRVSNATGTEKQQTDKTGISPETNEITAALTTDKKGAEKEQKNKLNAGKNLTRSTKNKLVKEEDIAAKKGEQTALTLNANQKSSKSAIKTNKNRVTKGAGTPEKDSTLINSTNQTATPKNIDQEELKAQTDSVIQEEKKEIVTDSIAKTDSVKTDSVQHVKALEPPLPLDGLASSTVVTVDAGVNTYLGWKYKGKREGRGFTPIAGVGITHSFNQKISLSSGLQYGCITYLGGSQQQTTKTTFGFGSTIIQTTSKPGILNYLALPLTVQYQFNNSNAVLIGGTCGLLLNRKNKIKRMVHHIAPSTSSTASADGSFSQKDYYAKSFSRIDASICVGYRRRLSSHFSLTASVNYGLVDLKNDTFFSENAVERTSGIKLILSYNLFDF